MTSFHVRHDFGPGVARDAILLLRGSRSLDGATFLTEARARDLEIGHRQSAAKVFASLNDLGLIKRAREGRQERVSLTELGVQLADVALRDSFMLAELIHLRYWSLWSDELGGPPFAWAYQKVAGTLWDEAPTAINTNRVVTMILAAAEERFEVSGVSFSSSSLLGVLHWLRALRPPCVAADGFRRRVLCPPEALVVALEWAYTAARRPLGVPLYINAATRQRVCRAILLEDEAFDEVLSQAEEILGVIHRHGDGGEMVLLQQPLFPGLIPHRKVG